jgi:hypothetical protein
MAKLSGAAIAGIIIIIVLVLGGATVGVLAGLGVIGDKKPAPPSSNGNGMRTYGPANGNGMRTYGPATSNGNGGAKAYPSQMNTNAGPSNPYYGGQYSKHDASMASVAAPAQGCNATLPMGYYPFSQNVAAAFDRQFPDSQDPSSLTKSTNPPTPRQQEFCGGGGQAPNPKGFLDLNTLVPQNWRAGDSACSGSADALGAQSWSAFSPSKSAFSAYQTAAGSARLGVNTRVKSVGTPNLLRAGTATPLTTAEFVFNDSDIRQSAVQNAIGIFPGTTLC